MDFKEREIDFREADRRYAELKRQLDAGTISTEEFDAQLRQLMVQDDGGRGWAKSRKTGEWNYHDGSAWVRGTPPGYQPPRMPPAESTPDRQSQLEQGERSPSSRTTLPGGTPTQDQNGEKQRRGVLSWVIVPAGLLVVVGIVVWIVAPGILGRVGLLPEEASSETESGYTLFEHPSGALWVEVPSGWKER